MFILLARVGNLFFSFFKYKALDSEKSIGAQEQVNGRRFFLFLDKNGSFSVHAFRLRQEA